MTSLCPKTGDTLADILINYRWNLKAMGWKQIIFTAFSSFDRFAVKKVYIFLWEKCLNSHLADVCVKNSFGICDVCVKISCAICEFKFSLGRRCTKEMVRSTIEYALGEISWRLQLLKQMFLWPEVNLLISKKRTEKDDFVTRDMGTLYTFMREKRNSN